MVNKTKRPCSCMPRLKEELYSCTDMDSIKKRSKKRDFDQDRLSMYLDKHEYICKGLSMIKYSYLYHYIFSVQTNWSAIESFSS